MPSRADSLTVTLSFGSRGDGAVGGFGLGVDGLARGLLGEALACRAPEPSATLEPSLPSSPPLNIVKPTKPITATIAATMAAVQLGRRRSGRMRSASNSGAAGVGAGRPPCSASNWRDERIGIEGDGAGERADVAARVDVTATAGEVVLFDRVHDGDAHPGGGTDLVDGQSCVDTGLLEGTTDRRPVLLGGRPVVFGGVADGHGGAFRACSHLLEVQSMGGTKGWGNRAEGVCTPSEWPGIRLMVGASLPHLPQLDVATGGNGCSRP